MTEPLVVTPRDVGGRGRAALAAWIRDGRDRLLDARRRRGAVLLRGFDLATADDFTALIDVFGVPLRGYDEGLSRRPELAPRVYPSTDYAPGEDIVAHNELCHTHAPPRSLFLFCVTPPATGGQTPLCDGRALLAHAGPFRERRITYVTNHPDRDRGLGLGRAWQDVYGADRDAVEGLLAARGTRWAWTEEGGLRTWRSGPGTAHHPVTGEECWFNQSMLWHVSNLGARGRKLLSHFGPQGVPTNAFFDDDEPIEDALLDHLRGVVRAEAFAFDWARGDFAFVDNYAMMHARRRYTGERLILLALGEA